MYSELSRRFWKLQQVPQTEEEQTYASLIADLESLTAQFSREISDLESTNRALRSSVCAASDLCARYDALKAREQRLRALQRDVDSFYY